MEREEIHGRLFKTALLFKYENITIKHKFCIYKLLIYIYIIYSYICANINIYLYNIVICVKI